MRKPSPASQALFLSACQLSSRDTKSQNFPVGRISHAKTFWTERVNRFCDICAPKVRKSLSRHICAKVRKSLSRHTCQSAKTLLTKVQDMDVATILQTIKYLSGKFPDGLESFQTVRKLSTLSGNFPHCQENFQTIW